MALLEVENLHTHIMTRKGAVRAVDGVSFELNRGETFALLGESGCGKSMTALSIMRLLPEHTQCMGRICVDGEEVLSLPEVSMRKVRGKKVAMIFQEPMTSLNPVLTVEQQIGESLERHQNLTGMEKTKRVIELLNDVGIPAPESRLKEYPHQLSGGMKQRVMIAIALAGQPELLIADEPTTALDVTIQAQILALLLKIQRESGLGILLITHDLGVVAKMADSVGVMYAGEMVERADRQSFFSHTQHPYSQKLFQSVPSEDKRNNKLTVIPGTVPSLSESFQGCRFQSRCDHAMDICRSDVPPWIEVSATQGARCHLLKDAQTRHALETPSEAEPRDMRDASAADAELLQVENLKVHFPIYKGILRRIKGYVYAVDGVSFKLKLGSTLAIVGESGCGKTTVGKGILQLLKPTSGHIVFEGQELQSLDAAQLRFARRNFQIIFQDPFSSMNPRMMVHDVIEEGMVAQNIGSDRVERKERIVALLQQVGLRTDALNRYPHEFSGGQRQRICIARALAVRPKMIVCDEPTSALDVSVQAQILNLLSSLQQEMGISYIFITHNISVVAYLAEEVAVMYLGRIVEHGKVEEVLDSPQHPYTKALLAAVPKVDSESKQVRISVEGDMPSPIHPPSGCHFHPRCPHVMDRCKSDYPPSVQHSNSHSSCCFLHV